MIGPPLPRPTDWFPLAPVDPLPGEPETIAAEAARLRTAARDMHEQIARLRGIAADGTLVGAYADKLRSESGDLADRLAKTVGRYEEVATSLDGWWPQLTTYQNTTISLLRQAQAVADRLVAHPDAAEAAATDLRTIQGTLKTTLEEAEDAGAVVARKVRDAIHDGIKDGRWDNFKDWVGKEADWLTHAADWMGIGATGLAVLAIAFPGVGFIAWTAIALTAVSALDHTALAAAGEGSWLDVGLDTFALATFGAGKVLGSGVKAAQQEARVAAARAARDAARKNADVSTAAARRAAARTLESATTSPAQKAGARRTIARAHRESRTAGTEAARNVRLADKPMVKRLESFLVGGDKRITEDFKDIRALRAQHPNNPAVTAPADRAEGLIRSARLSFAAGATADLADKGATWGAGEDYKNVHRRFTLQVGSSW